MNEIAYGSTMVLLLMMQTLLLWQTQKNRANVTKHVTDLGTELNNLGILMDEALDFIADLPNGIATQNPMIAQAGSSIQEVLLQSLISRMTNAQDYGSTSQQENRPDDEINSTQVETETQPS